MILTLTLFFYYQYRCTLIYSSICVQLLPLFTSIYLLLAMSFESSIRYREY